MEAGQRALNSELFLTEKELQRTPNTRRPAALLMRAALIDKCLKGAVLFGIAMRPDKSDHALFRWPVKAVERGCAMVKI